MKQTLLHATMLLALAAVDAFQASPSFRPRSLVRVWAEEGKEAASESVFVPPSDDEVAAASGDEEVLQKVESFGRGAAKVRRGCYIPRRTVEF